MIKFFVIDRWSLIIIRDAELFNDVVTEECKCTNYVKLWNCNTIHKSHTNCCEDCRVLKVHYMLRTSIQIHIFLNGLALGCLVGLTAAVGRPTLI
jgi:hypothetical protein